MSSTVKSKSGDTIFKDKQHETAVVRHTVNKRLVAELIAILQPDTQIGVAIENKSNLTARQTISKHLKSAILAKSLNELKHG